MADQRVTLLIDGEVQGVGYRALVRKAGRKLGLTGYVHNLDDGRVKVVVEGDPSVILELEKAIQVQNHLIEVESIERSEGEVTGKYSGFMVRSGELIDEIFQSMETARRYLGFIATKVDVVGEKVDGVGAEVRGVGEKVDGVGTEVRTVGEKVDAVGEKVVIVGEKVDGVGAEVRIVADRIGEVQTGNEIFQVQTSENFAALDGKYHTVSGTLKEIKEEVAASRHELKRLVDHVVGDE